MSIQTGFNEIVVAGGVESMSQAPYLVPANTRSGNKMGSWQALDHMLYDGLTDARAHVHMGITAENIAAKFGITREAQDEFALSSQQKAVAAIDKGKFKEEIVPIVLKGKKDDTVFDTDEFPNRETSLEKLSKLRPAFKEGGSVTAGNASGINDGASFVVVAGEAAVKKYGLKPIAEIIGMGQGGVDPLYMGLAPVPAIRNALKYASLKLSDMELIELNEAFAAQALGVVHELVAEHGVDRASLLKITNVNGGAIALGHPVGVSGNRILVTLLYEMIKRKQTIGLASLCIGGGQGTALIVKMMK
ncbi:MAG: acetyl-CoA C-acyltransferase [Treponema sp.]